jgi:hypothetical protein
VVWGQVSLGAVGKNVGAGMTGGLGYFFEDGADGSLPFADLVNHEIVKVQRVVSKAGEVRSHHVSVRPHLTCKWMTSCADGPDRPNSGRSWRITMRQRGASRLAPFWTIGRPASPSSGR